MESTAWLLNFGGSHLAAVGKRELLHLVQQPTLFDVPRTPRHCSRVMIWQNRMVPVWDIVDWLAPGSSAESANLLAVFGYQSARRQVPRFGAMSLAVPPLRVAIADSLACELTLQQTAWRKITSSCFLYEKTPTGILDLPLIFSGGVTNA